MSPPADNLLAHLRDAARHLERARRSLECARTHVRRGDSDRQLARLERYAAAACSALLCVARLELERPKARLR